MPESICIFLEQHYLPKRYKENIENLFNSLKKNYRVDIFSPEIDLNLTYNKNLYKVVTSKIFSVRTSASFNYYYDILIIFSDYNHEITFDRRLLVIKSIPHKRLITISGYKPFIYKQVGIFNNINLMDYYFYNTNSPRNRIRFNSIFNSIFTFNKDEVKKFKLKYKIKKNIIALIPGPIENWKINSAIYNKMAIENKNQLNSFFNNLNEIKQKLYDKSYEILGIRYFSDDYSLYRDINIKWVEESEYNILKFCSSAIISLSNDNFFRYLNCNKPIIKMGLIPFLYKSKTPTMLYNYLLNILNIFYEENDYENKNSLGHSEFVLKSIKKYRENKNISIEQIDFIINLQSINEISHCISINNRI